MSVRSAQGMFSAAFGAALMLVAASCQDSRQAARRQVGRELEQRDQNRQASLRAYERGRTAFDDGRFEDAQRLLSESARAEPDAVYTWMLLGQAEFEQGRFFEAAEAFDRAGRLEPTRYEPKFNLALVFESTGRLREAIDAYEAALVGAPDQVEVMENLARAYVRAGERPERARELIERALLTERRPEWRRWLGLQAARLAEELDPQVERAPFGRTPRSRVRVLPPPEDERPARPVRPATRFKPEPETRPAPEPARDPAREPDVESDAEPEPDDEPEASPPGDPEAAVGEAG